MFLQMLILLYAMQQNCGIANKLLKIMNAEIQNYASFFHIRIVIKKICQLKLILNLQIHGFSIYYKNVIK